MEARPPVFLINPLPLTLFCFAVLGIELLASHTLSKCSTPEVYLQLLPFSVENPRETLKHETLYWMQICSNQPGFPEFICSQSPKES